MWTILKLKQKKVDIFFKFLSWTHGYHDWADPHKEDHLLLIYNNHFTQCTHEYKFKTMCCWPHSSFCGSCWKLTLFHYIIKSLFTHGRYTFQIFCVKQLGIPLTSSVQKAKLQPWHPRCSVSCRQLQFHVAFMSHSRSSQWQLLCWNRTTWRFRYAKFSNMHTL